MSEIDLKRFFLEQVRLFEHFPADKVEEIVSQGQLASYEGNEAILETGDDSKYIGVLITGHAEISITDNTGTRSVLSQLGPGDVFGVMSILTGERLSADVIAGNRCYVLLIPQAVFNAHILTNPKAIAYLSRLLLDRMRNMSLDIVAGQTASTAKSDDPYALSLLTGQPGKVVALNVGVSQIHFGIYDTKDSGADVHGIVDNADPAVVCITVMVGTQVKTQMREPFPLTELFRVMQEATRLLGDAFTFHAEEVLASVTGWSMGAASSPVPWSSPRRSSPKSKPSRCSRPCTTR